MSRGRLGSAPIWSRSPTVGWDGYVVVADVLGAGVIRAGLAEIEQLVEASRLDPQTGDKVVGGTVHLGGLDVRAAVLEPAWTDARVLAAVHDHLGPNVRLDISYRAAQPGYGAQTLHVDATGSAPPKRWRVCNALIALVELTEVNGATRVVPGTHLDPDHRFRPRGPRDRHPDEQVLTAPAGSAIVFSGHVLHGGSANRSAGRRHAVLATWHRCDDASARWSVDA